MLGEPTNDLDTDTLAAVEDLLDGWPGTLIVVSHDRYLLERVCDRQWALLGDGALRDLPGGVEQYLALRREARSAGGAPAASSSRSVTGAATSSPVAAPAASPAETRAARKEIARVERRLARIADEEKALHEKMAADPTDYSGVAALDARLRELSAEKEELEMAWLEAAEVAG